MRTNCYTDGSVAYDLTDDTCTLLATPPIASNMSRNVDYDVAIADKAQLRSPTDVACPYGNNTVQTTHSGEQFKILCNKDFAGYGDYCPYSLDPPYGCHPHADSLEECMEICSKAHPLCTGVSWNVDLENGWENCYLKDDITTSAPTSWVYALPTLETYANPSTFRCRRRLSGDSKPTQFLESSHRVKHTLILLSTCLRMQLPYVTLPKS